MAVAGLLHDGSRGWAFGEAWLWRFLYDFGEMPIYAAVIGSLVLLVGGTFARRLLHLRRMALYLLLAALIGPCLIVNAVLKDHWGRPRPRQVDLFGGNRQHQHVWEKGPAGKGKSFPCGHAAAGFFLLSPYFVLRRRKPRSATRFLALGIGYGVLMGIGRMAQGGHFLTDVIGAGVIVYLVGLTLSVVMGLEREGAAQGTLDTRDYEAGADTVAATS
jgi:membrane-associated PAP2 superfamily phosphatase